MYSIGAGLSFNLTLELLSMETQSFSHDQMNLLGMKRPFNILL